jgi:hydroxymethylpyrimidine pyrophosphatase-like HAD family hydrolase
MTYFIDLDGTVLYYHKNKFVDGARLMLRTLIGRGHQIVLITQRGPQDADKEWSIANTKRFFADMNLGDVPLVFGVQPGRVVVDDTLGAYVFHKQNRHWDEQSIGDLLRPKGM